VRTFKSSVWKMVCTLRNPAGPRKTPASKTELNQQLEGQLWKKRGSQFLTCRLRILEKRQ
jgi:hypothetical protein